MRRALASLLMLLANLALAVAITAWWLQHTVFDPGRAEDVAAQVLAVEGVQTQITDAITTAIATELGQDPDTIAVVVDQAAATTAGVDLLTQVVVDSHAVIIGASDGPVQITPQQLAELLGDERALLLPAITLPVETVAPIDTARRVVDGLVLPALLVALVLGVLAFVIHPTRHMIVRRWGLSLMFSAAVVMAIGYVVPALVLPSLTDSPWVEAVPDLARDNVGLLGGVALVLAGAGLALIAGSGLMARRHRAPVPARRQPAPADPWR